MRCQHLQCVISLPDKNAATTTTNHLDPLLLQWAEDGQQDTRVLAQGNHTTVIFDSFSDEADVQRRNIGRNNISKINDPARRFAADFSVRVSGEVTAILSPCTVADYRVVDTQRGRQQAATKIPPPNASFGSVVAGNFHHTPPPPPSSSLSWPRQQQPYLEPTDSELIASLSDVSSSTAAPASSSDSRTSFLAELSLVADQLCAFPSSSPAEIDRVDTLRRHCQGAMLQQRRAQQHAAAMQQQRRPITTTVVNADPNTVHTTRPITVLSTSSSPADPALVGRSSFFAPIPRPVDVHQTLLLQTAQAGRKRMRLDGRPAASDDDAAQPASAARMGAHGDALDGGGGTASQWANNPPLSSSSCCSSVSSPSSFHDPALCLGAVDTRATPATELPSWPVAAEFNSASHHTAEARELAETSSSSSSSWASTSSAAVFGFGGAAGLFLPPIAVPANPFGPAENSDATVPCSDRQRVSSSDLIFTSFACPVPVSGLLNLADIQFRRSSEELVALSVLQDLGAGGRK